MSPARLKRENQTQTDSSSVFPQPASALHSSSERSNRMTTSEEKRIILLRAGSRVYEGTDPSVLAKTSYRGAVLAAIKHATRRLADSLRAPPHELPLERRMQ